jgi:L-cysteine S-thiosulfotransferase
MTPGAMRWRKPALLVLPAALTAAALLSAQAEIPLDQRRSSYADMSRDNKAMQDDDTSNPGMLAVLDGEALWQAKAGAPGRACADCHGDAQASMKGVAARHPAHEATLGRPVNLEQRINLCRTQRQNAQAFAYESKELLALTAFVAMQSRGEPIAPPDDPRLRPFRDNGRALFTSRQGQLNLACSQCHDDNWGKSLAGNTVTQGHPTGYPIYRLEWQSLGSLQRRLRNCMIGMRAEPYTYGAPEYVDMELHLMWRARGMTVETPAVRP